MTQFGFQASWDSLGRESFAELIEPHDADGYTYRPYIALWVGGHGGLRISIDNLADAETLGDLLTQAVERFRQSQQSGVWARTTIRPEAVTATAGAED